MIKRGLSEDPKHRERMGNRIWLFMHMIDRADWETGIVYDWRDNDEAHDMGLEWRTLQKQRQELEKQGYIFCQLKRGGQNITIHNWRNPRNYSGKVFNPKGTQNSVPSDDESTPEGTPEGTPYPNRDLGTPTMQFKNQESKPKRAYAQKKPHLNYLS